MIEVLADFHSAEPFRFPNQLIEALRPVTAQVSDPDAFIHDTAALEAVRAIASKPQPLSHMLAHLSTS